MTNPDDLDATIIEDALKAGFELNNRGTLIAPMDNELNDGFFSVKDEIIKLIQLRDARQAASSDKGEAVYQYRLLNDKDLWHDCDLKMYDRIEAENRRILYIAPQQASQSEPVAYNHYFKYSDGEVEQVLSHQATVPVIQGLEYSGKTEKLGVIS
jgi:hypothetical protein